MANCSGCNDSFPNNWEHCQGCHKSWDPGTQGHCKTHHTYFNKTASCPECD